MQFTVPQFIEHEGKIFGPLTFKQFIFIGVAGAVCFALYFCIGKTNFFLFLVLSIIILGIGTALAFLKIGGRNLPTILKNFLSFLVAPKIYLWQRKELPLKFIRGTEKKVEVGTKPTSTLKFAEKSLLKKLSTQIETGNK